jgi:hypothetical protein
MIDFASLPQNRRINRHENRFDAQFINMPEQFLGLLHLLYPHNAGKTLESPPWNLHIFQAHSLIRRSRRGNKALVLIHCDIPTLLHFLAIPFLSIWMLHFRVAVVA